MHTAINEYTLGTGIDIVEGRRMHEVITRWGRLFTERVFVDDEIAYCENRAAPWRHYAGRFAVKEAVSKAFGSGIGPVLGWHDIEVVRLASGAPVLNMDKLRRAFAATLDIADVTISLSHSRDYAVAHALAVFRPAVS